jgi:hypothetical protein
MIPIVFWVFESALLGVPDRGEVRRQRRLGPDGDDLAVLLPDLLEQLGKELATLAGLGLGRPEAGEVIEKLAGAIEMRIGRRVDALDLFLQRLPGHDLSGLGEILPSRLDI